MVRFGPEHPARVCQPRQRPSRASASSPRAAPSPTARAAGSPPRARQADADVGRYAQPEFEQFSNLASSAADARPVGRARQAPQRALQGRTPASRGLVVTSGTDTLEELAYFLDLTVRTDKPVVVVGSMRNPSTLGYEGAANLLEGFRVAAVPDARGKGALVVLNDEINAAREVTKTDALRLKRSRRAATAFSASSTPIASSSTVTRQATHRSAEFDVATMTGLPRVDVILVYQGANGDLIKSRRSMKAPRESW